MTEDVEVWLEKEGKAFLEEIGIEKGQRVLDYGCGAGHYTIPAARIVDGKGIVYALDKDRKILDQLARLAESEGLKNIVHICYRPRGLEIGLEDESIDIMLLYDVLHYLKPRERKKVYRSAYKALKAGGILSVYPKHCRSDEPLRNLADLVLEDIVEEIENTGFRLERKEFKKLVHDENFDKGYILNHRKPVV